MKNWLTLQYIKMKSQMYSFKNELEQDERGVSAIVATVILVLVVILLAVAFWGAIKEWFEGMMDRILTEGGKDAFSAPKVGG